MKKIYYLLLLGVLGFTACQKEPQLETSSHTAPLTVQTLNVTLQSSDYGKISSGYPKTSLSFNNLTDANTYVPQILNAEYPATANTSTAVVKFALNTNIQVADSLYKDLTYTVTAADYTAAGSTYGDFTPAEVLAFVAAKYTNPAPNQLVVLTYVLYSGSDSTVTNSFLYLNGSWRLIYQVTPAEYTIVGEGKYNEMTSSDLSKLPGYFGFFLKNDVTIADTVKAGDIEYVSYNYYVSSGASKGDYQKVMALTYDGNNWSPALNASATFVKANGAWKPQPIIAYTLTSADITLIANGAAGSSSGKSNLSQYKDFDSSWKTADMDAAIIECLLVDFPTPQTGTVYKVTYPNYSSPAPDPLNFIWTGSKWQAEQ
ncbi:MAG: hypothetical protein ACTHJ8_11710 [Mucilaginibacter sp.]|jgi:hypothetical protein